jgi:hypothetical protein
MDLKRKKIKTIEQLRTDYGVLMICINTSEVDAVLENAAHFTTASALSRSCHANHFGLLWLRCNQPK